MLVPTVTPLMPTIQLAETMMPPVAGQTSRPNHPAESRKPAMRAWNSIQPPMHCLGRKQPTQLKPSLHLITI